MKTSKVIVFAALAFYGVTAFAYVQVGTDPLDNMPLMASDAQYAQMTNNAAKVTFAEGKANYFGEPDKAVPFDEAVAALERGEIDAIFLDTNKTHEAVVEYVQVRKDEYDVLTSRFEKVWSSFHDTEEGRIRLHGSRKSQIVTETQKLTTYADGYTHAENIVKRVPRPRPVVTNRIERMERIIQGTDRYKEFKRRMAERMKNKPKEVTVEHDAVTGKDTEVK